MMKWKQNLQKITAGTVAGALLVVGLSGCDSTTESTSQANTDAQGEAVTINVAYFDSFVWSYYIQIAQKYGICHLAIVSAFGYGYGFYRCGLRSFVEHTRIPA